MRRRPKPGPASGGHQEPPPSPPAAVEEGAEYTQRATFYFSDDQLMDLEVVMLKLRTEQRLKVGKSEIMRAALDFILEDYDKNKEKCWLVRRVLNQG